MGSAVRSASLWAVRRRTWDGRPGVKFLKYPAGIVSLAALLIILLNLFASFEALDVEGVDKNIASVFSVKEFQSAFLKLVNVLL